MWRRIISMGRLRIVKSLLVMLPMLALLSAGSAVADATRETVQPSTRSPQDCQWNFVNSPNREIYNTLNAVSALSSNDVWAVGSSGNGNFDQLTLIEHWNGSQWFFSFGPNPGSSLNTLEDVVAITPNDVWAVGYYGDVAVNAGQTLILHWTTSGWSQVPSPNPGTLNNELHSISAVSANDIWAVGHTWIAGTRHRTLVLHWNGSQWSVVPSPNASAFDNHLTGVAALSANDVWAVGYYESASSGSQTLVEHWDGNAWSVVPSPNSAFINNFLNGVAVVSANDVWAVGNSCAGNCFFGDDKRAVVMHWDGSVWNMVPHPNPGPQETVLNDVTALSSNNVWAAGYNNEVTQGRVLITHWDGTTWSVVPSAQPLSVGPSVKGIATLASNDVWAVGDFHFAGNPVFHTLTERYSGDCGSSTPTPTATSVAPTATRTYTPAATSTPCAVTFSDVSPSDYFYEAVRHLYCGGVISGYGDGTFRPYNNTTRGQISKIVVLAEGWQIQTPADPTFVDVPTDSAFFPYVETAYAQGIVSGYSCGTDCLEFRPDNYVNRGQLTKIIVLAQDWTIAPPSEPTFRDVPPSDPFYGYVETAYAHEIITGYSCGPGCLEFRPINNATRGQICKIVYSAVGE